MSVNGVFKAGDQRKVIRKNLLFFASTTGLAVTGCLALQAPALAQTASATETVTVTASRVNRAGYDAPTPTTVIGASTLEAQALLNASDYINNIPQMTPIIQVGNAVSVGENRPDFRGLGPVRTLVLIDGDRVSYTDPLGGVDLNIMPTALLKSIEVVSGGASAEWGSDAVTGVMNFHLNNKLEGIKGSFQCGESQYNDDQQCGGGVAAGASFLNSKLHVVVAGDFESSTGVENAPNSGRKWAANNTALVFNSAYVAGNGQPQFLLTQNACYAQTTSAGLISKGPLAGITFNTLGQPEPFAFGTNTSATFDPANMQGGSCEPYYGRYSASQTSPIHRQNGYTRFTYDLSDTTSIYAEALYAHSSSYDTGSPANQPGNLTIKNDNAFLPASIKALMAKNNVTTFTMGRFDPELSPAGTHGQTKNTGIDTVDRYVVGGKGAITGSWTWDAHVQYQRSEYDSSLYGRYNTAKFALAADAVIDPNTGLPACRSTLTAPTNGCVPIDLFGAGSITQNAKSYVGGTATAQAFYTHTGAAANIQGEPIDLPAGPVSVAGGFETRTEHLSVVVDPISGLTPGGWNSNGLANESGHYTVNEGYLEAVVPILKNVTLAKNLDVNLAGRITDYSISGEVDTWKMGVNYTPFESNVVRFRGSLSVDSRAPTLNELFSNLVGTGIGSVTDPACGGCVAPFTQFTGGNTGLVPEVARTKLFGVVLQPDFLGLDGLTLSADYYDIKISNGIISLLAQQVVNNCALGVQSACAGITRTATGALSVVKATYFNSQGIESEGVDLEATYVKPLSSWFSDLPGSLTVHSLVAYVGQQTTTNGTAVFNNVGNKPDGMTFLGTPQWSGNVSAMYDLAPWQFYAQMNFVGKVFADKVNSVNNAFYRDNAKIPVVYTFNTNIQYTLNDSIRLYGGVDNLLNQAVPVNAGPSTLTSSAVGGDAYYDRIGRRFKVGIRFNY